MEGKTRSLGLLDCWPVHGPRRLEAAAASQPPTSVSRRSRIPVKTLGRSSRQNASTFSPSGHPGASCGRAVSASWTNPAASGRRACRSFTVPGTRAWPRLAVLKPLSPAGERESRSHDPTEYEPAYQASGRPDRQPPRCPGRDPGAPVSWRLGPAAHSPPVMSTRALERFPSGPTKAVTPPRTAPLPHLALPSLVLLRGLGTVAISRVKLSPPTLHWTTTRTTSSKPPTSDIAIYANLIRF